MEATHKALNIHLNKINRLDNSLMVPSVDNQVQHNTLAISKVTIPINHRRHSSNTLTPTSLR